MRTRPFDRVDQQGRRFANAPIREFKVAEQVRKSAPEAIRQTKRLLKELDRKTFGQDLAIALPYHHQSREGPEAKEGARAFFEKRLPSWL